MGVNPLIGEVQVFAGSFAPQGWLLCDGGLHPISQYNALFSLLGTRWGGDGRTNFGVPDLRGRIPMGAGNGPGLTPCQAGDKVGTESVTLTTTQMPTHNHTLDATFEVQIGASSNQGNTNMPSEGVVLAEGFDKEMNEAIDNYAALGGSTVQLGGTSLEPTASTTEPSGSSGPHENIMPSLVLNYIIAYEGTYPPRS